MVFLSPHKILNNSSCYRILLNEKSLLASNNVVLRKKKKQTRYFRNLCYKLIAFNLNQKILTIQRLKILENQWDCFPSASVDIRQDEIVADFYMQLLTCCSQTCIYIADISIWRSLENLDSQMEKKKKKKSFLLPLFLFPLDYMQCRSLEEDNGAWSTWYSVLF